MSPELAHHVLTVTLRLGIIEPASVILDCSNLDKLIGFDFFEFVSGCDDSVCSPADVVGIVARNDCACAEEVIVAVQDKTRPGKLVRLGLAALQRPIRCDWKPLSALIASS